MVTIAPHLAHAIMLAGRLAAAGPPAAHSAVGPAGLLLLLVLTVTVFFLSAVVRVARHLVTLVNAFVQLAAAAGSAMFAFAIGAGIIIILLLLHH
jgi:hypothetical protein